MSRGRRAIFPVRAIESGCGIGWKPIAKVGDLGLFAEEERHRALDFGSFELREDDLKRGVNALKGGKVAADEMASDEATTAGNLAHQAIVAGWTVRQVVEKFLLTF
jgi:hypothetical protein